MQPPRNDFVTCRPAEVALNRFLCAAAFGGCKHGATSPQAAGLMPGSGCRFCSGSDGPHSQKVVIEDSDRRPVCHGTPQPPDARSTMALAPSSIARTFHVLSAPRTTVPCAC